MSLAGIGTCVNVWDQATMLALSDNVGGLICSFCTALFPRMTIGILAKTCTFGVGGGVVFYSVIFVWITSCSVTSSGWNFSYNNCYPGRGGRSWQREEMIL